MKVSILKRVHAGGKIGLYLQFSKPVMMPDSRMARREPLGIVLYDPIQKKLTSEQKAHNRETEQIAETVRAKRQLEVQASTLGVSHESSPIKLADYLRLVQKGRAKSTVDGWKRIADLVVEAGITVSIGKLTVQHCLGFRNYLTVEELTRLMQTPTKYPGIRGVIFFAALTGLRTSEIRDLEWSGIKDMPDGSAVMTYFQRKTGKTKTRPMPSQARAIIGHREEGKVFPHIIPQCHLNTQLRRWAADAGIEKHISLHCMRHTFATLQLSAGTPLHVVSDMLDYSSIRMTEVYAKILDSAVSEASERIRIDAPITQRVLIRLVKGAGGFG